MRRASSRVTTRALTALERVELDRERDRETPVELLAITQCAAATEEFSAMKMPSLFPMSSELLTDAEAFWTPIPSPAPVI